MTYPKVSVITPSYNAAKYIEDAIKSVLIQDYPKFEHIIVDGGSSDNTIEILRKYSHLKWVSKPDRGQSDAMNKGFEMSSGKIIVYLNADDYFEPGAFSAVLPHLEEGSQFVVGKVKILRDDGAFSINDPKVKFSEMLRYWEPNAYCYNPAGYFYRRNVQKSIGGFNTQNDHSMDLEFLLEASRRVTLTKIDAVLGVFRLIEGTKTSRSAGYEYFDMKFRFCDRYLIHFDRSYVDDYIRKREEYLTRERKGEEENSLIKDLLTNIGRKNYHLSLLLGLRLFLQNPMRWSKILVMRLMRSVGRWDFG